MDYLASQVSLSENDSSLFFSMSLLRYKFKEEFCEKVCFEKVQLGLQVLMVSTLLAGTSATTALAIEQQTTASTQPDNATVSSTSSDEQDTTTPTDTADTSQRLTILGTSDVHGQLWNWSYEDDKQTPVGLSQVSSVVNNIRAENPNGTILIDNGDMNQGTILTDDLYNKAPLIEKPNPMIKAMNYMNYDAMVLGNHEFNFGLDLIKKLETEAAFPILSANTYVKDSGSRFVGGTTKKRLI